MSEDATTGATPLDELALLKDRARQLGIPVSGNIGVDTLRQRIKDALEAGDKATLAAAAKAAPARHGFSRMRDVESTSTRR